MNAPHTNRLTHLLLEFYGYKSYKADSYNSFAKCTTDLMGFADMIALPMQCKGDVGAIIAIQKTSRDNIGARQRKIEALESAKLWMRAGHIIWIVGWYSEGRRLECKVRKLYIAGNERKQEDFTPPINQIKRRIYDKQRDKGRFEAHLGYPSGG